MAHVPHPTHHLTQWTGTVYPFLFTPYIYNIPQWPFSAPGSLWEIMDVMQRTLPQQSCAPPNLKKTYFYINSAICRPSDLGPEPRFEPETGVLEAGTLTSITDHHTSITKMCITFLRSRVDFLYYDGSPPSYDYEYYNDYNDISKVTILELSRKILPLYQQFYVLCTRNQQCAAN